MLSVIKSLVVAGVLGLIVGGIVYIFIYIQRRLENRELKRWERDNAALSSSELEAARQKKNGNRIFPGVSNKFLLISASIVIFVMIAIESGLLK